MISYVFEGAKGTGKSTLVNYVNNVLGHEINEWSDAKKLFVNDLDKHINDEKYHVYGRGFLSYSVYRWAQDYETILESKHHFTELQTTALVALSRKHFEYLIDNVDHYVVLYASNENDLFNRIKKRNAEIGKGATKDEWDVIGITNQAFKSYGEMLKYLRPDKVKLIDISDQKQIDDFIKSIS